jgi:hypothetical protein
MKTRHLMMRFYVVMLIQQYLLNQDRVKDRETIDNPEDFCIVYGETKGGDKAANNFFDRKVK